MFIIRGLVLWVFLISSQANECLETNGCYEGNVCSPKYGCYEDSSPAYEPISTVEEVNENLPLLEIVNNQRLLNCMSYGICY